MMFKIFLRPRPPGPPRTHRPDSRRPRSRGRRGLVLALLCTLAVAVGCRSLPPMAPVNLTAPGWTVAKGQAVWQVAPGEELAGELLIATRPDGAAFVQFIKTPFPLVLAQVTTNQWEIQFPARHKRYSGRGKPPARLLWLNLPQAVTGKPLPKPWHRREEPNGWRLENSATGESLEGYFIGS